MWKLVPAEEASSVVTFGITGLAVVIAVAVVGSVTMVSSKLGKVVGVILVCSAIGQLVLAEFGVLQQWELFPPPFMLMLIPLFALTIGFATSSSGQKLGLRLPIAALIGFQVFRLPLELLMHQASLEGVMPPQLTYTGFNFDIVTGTSALFVAVLAFTGVAPRWLLLTWNVAGALLLLVVLVLAIISMPLFGVFGPERINTWVTYPPFVLLPGILVQAALLGHILVWRKLQGN